MKLEIGSQEWLDARRNLITATDAAVILGVSPWKTRLQLYYDKVNGSVTEQTAAMKRGLDLEPEARKAFENMTGEFVCPEFRIHPELKWMGASFDGINDSGVLVEIKCPGSDDHKCALDKRIPDKYVPQLQHQMYVAGIWKAYYFSYRPTDSNPCALVMTTADKKFQDKMVDDEKAFWDMVQSKTPPDAEDRDILIREDRVWLMMEEELLGLIHKVDALSERKEELRKKMIEMCENRPTRGYRLKFNPVMTKGSVDYSKIEALNGVDLEPFRKASMIRWRMDEL